MIKKIILTLVSIWWGWTVIIDFAVVPMVFRIINDFFNAGELGVALFSKLNIFELIASSLLLIIASSSVLIYKKEKTTFALILSAWIITLIYFFYLTPKLLMLTELWKKADSANQIGISGISDIQQEHQFFHKIYVTIDSLKLFILSIILGLQLFKREKSLEST
jgi:hypothetical protein